MERSLTVLMLISALWLGFAVVLASGSVAGPAVDTDGDGIFDVLDNCRLVANAGVLNCDTDGDGYGNACDGDFDQNFATTAVDFNAQFVPAFKKGAPTPTGTDMDCNGFVTAVDFSTKFVPNFKFGKPGP